MKTTKNAKLRILDFLYSNRNEPKYFTYKEIRNATELSQLSIHLCMQDLIDDGWVAIKYIGSRYLKFRASNKMRLIEYQEMVGEYI